MGFNRYGLVEGYKLAITQNNYLDLRNIVINEIIGDPLIFIAIFAIFTIIVAHRIGLRGLNAFIFIIFANLVMNYIVSGSVYNAGLVVIMLLLMGYAIFRMISEVQSK